MQTLLKGKEKNVNVLEIEGAILVAKRHQPECSTKNIFLVGTLLDIFALENNNQTYLNPDEYYQVAFFDMDDAKEFAELKAKKTGESYFIDSF